MKFIHVVYAATVALTLGWTPASALDRLKVASGQKGTWDSSIAHFGQEKGFFKDQGLEIDLQWTDGGADTLQAVITGSFDIGLSNGILGVVSAWAKQAPVILLSSEMTGSPDIFWYVRADSPIKTLNDLDGKSMAFSRAGSSTELVARALVKHAGINAKLVPAGGMPAVLTQVMSGQIDAGWGGAPQLLDQVEQGKLRIIATGNDAAAVAAQTVRVNITNANTFKQRRDVLRRFLIAYNKSLDWMYSSPEVVDAFAKFANINPKLVPQMQTKYSPRASMVSNRIGDIDGIMAVAVASRRLDKPLTKEQIDAFLRPMHDLH